MKTSEAYRRIAAATGISLSAVTAEAARRGHSAGVTELSEQQYARLESQCRSASETGGPATAHSKKATPRKDEKKKKKQPALDWLRFTLPIADPKRLARILSLYLSSYFAFHWNRRTQTLEALWHERRSRHTPTEEKTGPSFSDELAKAASAFDISPATLRRLVKPNNSAANIQWSVYNKILKEIQKAVDAPRFLGEIEASVLGARNAEILESYLAVIRQELERSSPDLRADDVFGPEEEGRPDDPLLLRADFKAFEISVVHLGAPATRWQLGYRRVYEGLIAWQPLRDALGKQHKEARPLVRAGFRRELALVRAEMRVLRDLLVEQHQLVLRKRDLYNQYLREKKPGDSGKKKSN